MFFQNLDLILAHKAEILKCDEYFFCRPAFAGHGRICFYSGINLGTLLLGWRTGILKDKCRVKLGPRKESFSCFGTAYVYTFGGLASGTSWSGYCSTCQGYLRQMDNGKYDGRAAFTSAARDQFRECVEGLELEHFLSQKFTFAEPGLEPSRTAMIRKTKLSLIAPVSVSELVEELNCGRARKATAPDRTLIKESLVIMREGKVAEKVSVHE